MTIVTELGGIGLKRLNLTPGQNLSTILCNPNFLVIWPTDKCEGSKWGIHWSQTFDTSPTWVKTWFTHDSVTSYPLKLGEILQLPIFSVINIPLYSIQFYITTTRSCSTSTCGFLTSLHLLSLSLDEIFSHLLYIFQISGISVLEGCRTDALI